jgi:acyl homoserine lactone synthase
MYAIALTNRMFGQHLDLLNAMYRLRRRVYKERLDWTVSVSGDVELDVYDILSPTYLLVMTGAGKVAGSVRLLPTTGANMLADTFAILLGGEQPPCSERILESSRFCVDTELVFALNENGLNRVTFMLFAAMIEAGQAAGAEKIVTVTDTRMERVLRRAGWPLARIAEPQRLGETMALAGYLDGSDKSLAVMYRQAGIAGPVLVEPMAVRAVA